MKRVKGILVIAACALATACDESTSPQTPAETALSVVVQGGVAQLDEGRVYVRGPTNRELVMQPGTTDTITGLLPGTYTVALEGVTGGVVEEFGETTGIRVEAGRTTVANVTLNPFPSPTVSSIGSTAPLQFTVDLSAVTGAGTYDVEWDTDPGFSNPSDSTISAVSATFTIAQGGRHYVRARGVSAYGSPGAWSASRFVNVLPENPIAFVSDRDGNYEIYVMNDDGSDVTNLTNSPDTDDRNPKWSPDGARIAFARVTRNLPGATWGIYMMNADGTDVTEATELRSFSVIDLDWSPSGDSLVFDRVRGPTDTVDIYILDLATGDTANLTSDREYGGACPDWSPDGTRIAFQDGLGAWDIHVIGVDGADETPLTGYIDKDWHPAWSPDGSQIAYSRLDARWEVYVMNADGSGVTNLTGQPTSWTWTPAWSPDGERIAYAKARSDDDEFGIYIMYSIDGTEVGPITDHAATDWEPAWRPVQ